MNRSNIILIVACVFCVLLQVAFSFEATISGDPLASDLVTLHVDTEANVTYQVYASDDGASWTPLGEQFTGTGSRMDIVRPASSSTRLYKIAKPASWDDFSWNSSAWQ